MIALAPPLRAVFVPATHIAVFYRHWLGRAFEFVDQCLLQILFYVSEICGHFGEPNGDFAFFGRAGDDVDELRLGALQLGELFGVLAQLQHGVYFGYARKFGVFRFKRIVAK